MMPLAAWIVAGAIGYSPTDPAIRVATGDVVETQHCELLRYPNLIKYRRETTWGFGTEDVPLKTIAAEVSCDHLKIVKNRREDIWYIGKK